MAFSLSDYTDIRELARGGMGKVYLATQTSLGRTVVIKEMATGLVADESQIRRFENEARSSAMLSHPNVIRVYDFGRENDSFYISMEYIEGPSLQELVDDHDVPRLINLMIYLQALKGLHYAHSHEIIHRDVKPGNILVGQRTGQAKILDFGLAYAGSSAVHLTATETIVGTPQYMCPEQANGVEEKDIRMDIFSVGILMYQILTGDLPFKGNTIPAILYSVTSTKEQDIHEVVPWLPDELADNLRFALEKEPERRLPSLGTLIDAIQNLLYDIGIRDPVDTVRAFLEDRARGSGALYEMLLEYHVRKAEQYDRNGFPEMAKAHAQEALRYNPDDKRALHVLKGVSGGSTVLALLRKRKRSPEAAVLAQTRHRFPLGLVFASLALVVVLGSLGWLGYALWQGYMARTGGEEAVPVTKPLVEQPQPSPTPKPKPKPKPKPRTAVRASTKPEPKPRSPKLSPGKTSVLKISVDPPIARVYVDNNSVSGSSGVYSTRLKSGTHRVRAVCNGYADYERLVKVSAGVTQLVDIVLEREKQVDGLLHVHSYPWAELFVDGRYRGNTPTSPALELKPGKHSIVLRRDGYVQHEAVVVVKPGETTKTKVKLQQDPNY